ncbi:DUF4038 domain-containing protein [Streptomyces sp. NPDC058221]|uniref:apiosidase-like domain-containing protein n=1 Tax=Streptomyces sp. NPDC058221 TaxID=3346388 RepID=UPI0036E80D5A
MTPEFMARMGRYWDARYGSYPAIWTVAQEIDNDFYGRYADEAMKPWTSAAEALDRADSYDQPIMPHQEDVSSTTADNSRFASEPWHTGFASQWQQTDGWDRKLAEEYWNSGKPTLAYETPYEDFWTDGRHALSALYKSYLLGMRGYGYGASGLWNDVYSAPGEPLDAGTEYELPARYQWWHTGADRPTAGQLGHGTEFFTSLQWWKLNPRFHDSDWADFGDNEDAYLASDGNATYVALFADGTDRTGTLKGLDTSRSYRASWFDPRTGDRRLIDGRFEIASGTWAAPPKPSSEDWVLLVQKHSR